MSSASLIFLLESNDMSGTSQYRNSSSDDINDAILSYHKAKHSILDSHIRAKCIALNNRKITAEHFGGQKSHTIKLTAPVVELSVLDTYHNPEAKLDCLCTTYDLIFAELKSAIVSSISKHSDREFDIPVIDDKDILPILISVIVKSKLPYLWSNLKFLTLFFGENFKDEASDFGRVFKIFQEAVNKLLHFSEDSIEPNVEEDFRSLTLGDIISLSEKMTEVSEDGESEKRDLLQEEADRIVDLITTCTTSSDPA